MEEKLMVDQMSCQKCSSKGWNPGCFPTDQDGTWKIVKVWCEDCQGTGKVEVELDRTHIGFERE